MKDGWKNIEDIHSNHGNGESDAEVSSLDEDTEVLKLYFGSNAGLDLMNANKYL